MKNLHDKLIGIVVPLFLPLTVSANTVNPRGDVINTPSTSITSSTMFEQLCDEPSILVLIVICVVYFAALLYARCVWIVLPNNYYLRAYAEEIKAQLVIEQNNPGVQTNVEKVIKPAVEKLLKQLDELVPGSIRKRQWLLEGTGKQMAGWRHVHRAKVFATDLFSDSDAYAEAVITSKKLSELSSESAKGLSLKIDDELKKSTQDISRIKSLTKRGQELLFNERDNYFESLANWQNRATWLVFVSLLTLVVVGITNGNSILFVLGAIGGLLSRMSKVLKSKEQAFDYGASWSTLFLAPLVGALTGWSGVLLVLVLADVGVLGPMFENMLNLEKIKDIPWHDIEMTKETMALALAFGFSATLFERVMEGAESKIQNKTTAAASGKQDNK